MNLGEHFTLSEMTRTSRDSDNIPGDIHMVNLTRLVCLVLDPLRKGAGRLDVTSGYRCEDVNREVGGKSSSFHVQGLAADIMSERWTPCELMAKGHKMELPYDKMIAEDNGNSKWLHIQMQPAGVENRFERYTSSLVEGKMIYKKV